MDGAAIAVERIDAIRAAHDLADIVGSLQRLEISGAPPGRGVPLADRDKEFRYWLRRFDGDSRAVIEWERALAAASWQGPPVWHHGDLDARNWLIRDGRINGVIDWGCMGIGDPACDLMVPGSSTHPRLTGRFATPCKRTRRPGRVHGDGLSPKRWRSWPTTRRRTIRPSFTRPNAGSSSPCQKRPADQLSRHAAGRRRLLVGTRWVVARRYPDVLDRDSVPVIERRRSLQEPGAAVPHAAGDKKLLGSPMRWRMAQRAGLPTEEGPMSWRIAGSYFESCSCDVICPCTASMALGATNDYCRVVLVFHVKEGEVEGVDVGGLTVAAVADTPKVMTEGNWRVGVYIDGAAGDDQAEKLGGVFSGSLGGPMEALGPLIGENLGVTRAPITVVQDGLRHSVRIGDDVEIEIEDVVPFGVESGEPARLEGIFHPAGPDLTIARATNSTIDAFGIQYEARSAFSRSQFEWAA